MTRYAALLTILAASTISTASLAAPSASFQEARADYNPATGEIRVSVNSVPNWYVEHVGFASMTGDAPLGLLAHGGLVSDNDIRIGESVVPSQSMTYDISLGNVAATGIPNDGSLQILWNPAVGIGVQSVAIEFVTFEASGFIPEPTTLTLASLGLIGIGCFRRRNSRR